MREVRPACDGSVLVPRPTLAVSAGDNVRGLRVYANDRLMLVCEWAPDTPPWISSSFSSPRPLVNLGNLSDWTVGRAEPGDVGSLVGMSPPGAYRIDVIIDGFAPAAAALNNGYFAYAAPGSVLNHLVHVVAYLPGRLIVSWKDNMEPSQPAYGPCEKQIHEALAHISGVPTEWMAGRPVGPEGSQTSQHIYLGDRVFAVCDGAGGRAWAWSDGPIPADALIVEQGAAGEGFVAGVAPAGTESVIAVLSNGQTVTATLDGRVYHAPRPPTIPAVKVIATTSTHTYTGENGVVHAEPR
jgi:hypothetical protein